MNQDRVTIVNLPVKEDSTFTVRKQNDPDVIALRALQTHQLVETWKAKGSENSILINEIQEIENRIENGVYFSIGEKLTQYSRNISKELEDRLISDILGRKVE